MKKNFWKRTAAVVLGAVTFCGIFLTGCGSEEETGSSAVESDFYTVKFDLCTDLSTNKIKDRTVEAGEIVDEPTVVVRGDNPDNMRIEGWYEDEEYTLPWDFDLDIVTSNMTLYAKWESRYTVDFYLGNDTTPIASSLIKGGRKTEPCEDKCYGYEVLGYYTSRDYTQEFDFNTPITQNTSVYIKVGEQLLYNGEAMEKSFNAFAGKGGSTGNPTAGSIAYEEKKDEDGNVIDSYARVDFGHSNSRDPYVAVEYTDVDITKSQSLEITLKNLGDANQFSIYFIVKDETGAYLGKSAYSQENSMTYTYSKAERNMSEDDEWITLSFNLAEIRENWRNAASLYSLRVQSYYNSENPLENNVDGIPETVPNVLLIKSIKGVYDEKYDPAKHLVTYHCGDAEYFERVGDGEKIENDGAKCDGYKVTGYYADAACTIPYDFDTVVTGDTHIYVTAEEYIYFDGDAVARSFKAVAAPSGLALGSKAGSVALEEDYARANFGYSPNGIAGSTVSDPYIALENGALSVKGSNKIQITMKNLGGATQLGIFWVGKDASGEWVGDTTTGDWSASCTKTYVYAAEEVNMSEDDEWITVTIDLSDKATWTGAEIITRLRIESRYKSVDENDRSNEILIKEIKGVA